MRKARDIMTSPVITVHSDTSVVDLAKLLSEHRINGVPVVDDDGNIGGIVTEADLIDQNKKLHIPSVLFFMDSAIFLENPKKLDKELRKMAGTTVGDICTRDVITVEDETPIDEVASIMAEKRISTIPVMQGKRLVGIVGRGDLVRSIVT
jgi:CBS domain-containing protein|nr:CBS domain-containing protein [Deltaproteobacteria bacterium]